MKEIDFDLEENQEALRALYTALQAHQKFWSNWLADRLGFMADFFVGSDEEKQAATALGEALRTIARRGQETG